MDYKSKDSNGFAYVAMVLVVFPLFYLIESKYQSSILILPVIIIGNEYAYKFPRQAMKLYEQILFQSLLERFHVPIQILILVSIGVTEVYTLKTFNLLPVILFVFAYPLWFSFFQKQSLVVGSKSIIIGQNFFPYDSISSLSFKKEGLVLEAKGKSYTIYNWAIGKRGDKLKSILKEIGESVKA